MNAKFLLSADFYLRAIFVTSLFVLIFIAGVTYKHSLALAESTKWVMNTYKTNLQLEQFFSSLKDAETGQRGFIITRDSLFLESYLDTRQKLDSAFVWLGKLIETKQQEQYLSSLHTQVNLRLD